MSRTNMLSSPHEIGRNPSRAGAAGTLAGRNSGRDFPAAALGRSSRLYVDPQVRAAAGHGALVLGSGDAARL